MSVLQSKNNVPRLEGESLFETVCEEDVSVFLAPCVCFDAEPVSCSDSFSFFHCAPVPQEPQISVSSDVSEQPDTSDYVLVVQAVRHFSRWITITAERIYREIIRTFCDRFRNIVRCTGVQILLQSEILRF